jgi:arylsulfatase A-like enzyme
MIYADDLGYANPGSYGITRIPTPNCDRLTSAELRFNDAYTTARSTTRQATPVATRGTPN